MSLVASIGFILIKYILGDGELNIISLKYKYILFCAQVNA